MIRHVVYVIKENRTYDQVLGDMPEGNGDPGLCIFGERITPNQHKLAREFVLLDNTYCAGIRNGPCIRSRMRTRVLHAVLDRPALLYRSLSPGEIRLSQDGQAYEIE